MYSFIRILTSSLILLFSSQTFANTTLAALNDAMAQILGVRQAISDAGDTAKKQIAAANAQAANANNYKEASDAANAANDAQRQFVDSYRSVENSANQAINVIERLANNIRNATPEEKTAILAAVNFVNTSAHALFSDAHPLNSKISELSREVTATANNSLQKSNTNRFDHHFISSPGISLGGMGSMHITMPPDHHWDWSSYWSSHSMSDVGTAYPGFPALRQTFAHIAPVPSAETIAKTLDDLLEIAEDLSIEEEDDSPYYQGASDLAKKNSGSSSPKSPSKMQAELKALQTELKSATTEEQRKAINDKLLALHASLQPWLAFAGDNVYMKDNARVMTPEGLHNLRAINDLVTRSLTGGGKTCRTIYNSGTHSYQTICN